MPDRPGGYIRLHRQCLYNGWLKNHALWTFWSYCMLRASYQPYLTRVGCDQVKLETGQFVFGRRIAARELNMSEQTIRTCLRTLTKEGNLTHQSTHLYTVVTVCNFEFYQGMLEDDQPTYQPTPTTTNFELKPEENAEQKSLIEVKPESEKAFDAFWKIWPRKVSKDDARRAWNKVKPSEYPAIMSAVPVQIKSGDLNTTELKYCPHPATWLNAGRWKDENTEQATAQVFQLYCPTCKKEVMTTSSRNCPICGTRTRNRYQGESPF